MDPLLRADPSLIGSLRPKLRLSDWIVLALSGLPFRYRWRRTSHGYTMRGWYRWAMLDRRIRYKYFLPAVLIFAALVISMMTILHA